MEGLKRTVLYEEHRALGGKMVDFGGFEMPINYPDGILAEHLQTRRKAGLFDISHMGRFIVSGREAVAFLQHVLSNNVEALDLDQAQYTFLPTKTGGALDDAYLYRFFEKSYLLVVNAANAEKDWVHLNQVVAGFDAQISDETAAIGMISLQGPDAKAILAGMSDDPFLTEPLKNALGRVSLNGRKVSLAKTGYTGEAIGYEIFAEAADTPALWRDLVAAGAKPVGLGARDTLRLEAGLPLYGHELGLDEQGEEIPIFAVPLAKFAVSFAPAKGDYIGAEPLRRQFQAFERIFTRHFEDISGLPRMVRPFLLQGRGVPRSGCKVFYQGEEVGYVTSGSVVPYILSEGEGLATAFTEDAGKRFIGLALVRSDLLPDDPIQLQIRDKLEDGVLVRYHLRGDTPPYARPMLYEKMGAAGSGGPKPAGDPEAAAGPEVLSGQAGEGRGPADSGEEGTAPAFHADYSGKAAELLKNSLSNHRWRQEACINLIPSEQTHSPAARMLSILDPSFRYGEHRKMESFYDADVFYYQGTDFLHQVEQLLAEEFKKYFGCAESEIRATSGQMANTAVFSALMDFNNRANRKQDARRLGYVMNNHIIRGGHLSAQPMGALHDYIAVDPKTEKAALVNFPVLRDNPYRMDLAETGKIMEEYRPELIILGKSMILHREPVAEIRQLATDLNLETVIMYDMAHVLGLVGPWFQEPFKEGAEIVTGSTHKTFFGTQRGVVAANYREEETKYDLWKTIESRVFPGSVSNHHLGTLLGLLMAAYEMNCFRDAYQKNVIRNAKSFAMSLADEGLSVAGDPDFSYTETHQVVVNVGYGTGPAVARQLEENNLIVNYQATPDEEGFTASGALRLGVSEMTRFGFGPEEFAEVAHLMAEVILRGQRVDEDVKKLRSGFRTLKYCFESAEMEQEMEGLIRTLA